jgi:Aminopeptidase N
MKQLILILVIVLMQLHTYAQSFININVTNKPTPYEHNVDIIHLKVEPTFDFVNSKVMGTATHTFKALRNNVRQVMFHAEKMSIKQVTMNGKAATYTLTDSSLVVNTNKTLAYNEEATIAIVYECTPKKGIYFIGWNDSTGRSRKQIWTQGEGEDNHHWIPMYDKPNDKYTTEMLITMDNKYKVISNGALLSKKQKTQHYVALQNETPACRLFNNACHGVYDIGNTLYQKAA